MIRAMFACLLPYRAFHALGWPVRHVQRCVECGREFPALVRFEVDARWQ